MMDLTQWRRSVWLSAPVVLPTMFLVWRQDRHSPIYIAPRVGSRDSGFRMIKLRSMVKGDSSGVDSTSHADSANYGCRALHPTLQTRQVVTPARQRICAAR